MSIRRLNPTGLTQTITLVLFVAVFAIGGVIYLVASHADSCNTPVSGADCSSLSGRGGDPVAYQAECVIQGVPDYAPPGSSWSPIVTITNTGQQSFAPRLTPTIALDAAQTELTHDTFPTVDSGKSVSLALNPYTVPAVQSGNGSVTIQADFNNGSSLRFQCTTNFKVYAAFRGQVPLYSLYNSANHHHLYTSDPAQLAAAINNSKYGYQRLEGFVFTSMVPGTVPLYHAYKAATQDNFYTIDATARDFAIKNFDYTDQGTIGYINTASTNATFNLVPLHQLFNSSTQDHYYTTSDSLRNIAIRTYGYTYGSIEGYLVSP